MKVFKYLFFIIFFISLTSFKATSTKSPINWITLSQLETKMKYNPKHILIHFYTPSSGYCKKMNQTTFQDQEVIDYINDNFYAVKFNAELKNSVVFNGKTYLFNPNFPYRRNGSHEFVIFLLDGYLVYPSDVILDVDYHKIKIKRGASNSVHYLQLLKEIVNEHV